MANKFDGEAYVNKWDGKIAGIMMAFIVVSIALVVWLNKATKPDCTTHDYVFCGTALEDDHGAAPAHGEGAGAGHAQPGHGAGHAEPGHGGGHGDHGDHSHEH